MGVDVDLLTAFIRALGDAVNSKCSLVAAGGTALTLYGIKQSTEDVDFVVETGSMADVESAINVVNGPPTTHLLLVWSSTTRFQLTICRGQSMLECLAA